MAALARGEIRLVPVDNARIVGWCDIGTTTREGFGLSGRLGVGVLREYRRRGIGWALLERATSAARDRHLERVELDVLASNEAAISLYQECGFQLEGRKRWGRKIDDRYDDIVVMARLLDILPDEGPPQESLAPRAD
jgi:ribosomal protein S18 acetylase RimI-like enzyme